MRETGQLWNYMMDKGWLQAVDHFAECIATDAPMRNATPEDALKASILSHAAIESRNTGEIVKL